MRLSSQKRIIRPAPMLEQTHALQTWKSAADTTDSYSRSGKLRDDECRVRDSWRSQQRL